MLLQECVKKTAVVKTIPLCESFVIEIEYKYGQKHVSYNFYLLPHLPPPVIELGCLTINVRDNIFGIGRAKPILDPSLTGSEEEIIVALKDCLNN